MIAAGHSEIAEGRAMKSSSYMTRALQSRDRRYATVLGKLGYVSPLNASEAGPDPLDSENAVRKGGSKRPSVADELAVLRAEYKRITGRRPFNGWDAAELTAKLAEAASD
jgi:hypothetical protein